MFMFHVQSFSPSISSTIEMPAIFLQSFKKLITFRIQHHLILIQPTCWKTLHRSPMDNTLCLTNILNLLLITRYRVYGDDEFLIFSFNKVRFAFEVFGDTLPVNAVKLQFNIYKNLLVGNLFAPCMKCFSL